MKIKIGTMALAFAVVTTAFAQQPTHYCGTSEIDNQLVIDHPEILIERQKLEEFTQKFIQNQAAQKTANVIYTIPVVFHIIHNYGSENISDAQIYDEMKVLNRDFNKENADTVSVITSFKSKVANVGIRFVLAQKDPSGNCTNGIDRIASLKTYTGDNSAKFNPWPNNKYLNIWVVRHISSGAAGFAYYPGGTSASTDGIMVLSNYVGSIGTSSLNNSRAVTHEVGHYLNLRHVWGSTNDPGVSCGDDLVTDTPQTKGWDFCPAAANAKICNTSIIENYQNFMEYSYCCVMFTTGQATRMIAALNSSTSGRNNLWTTANLTATGTNTPNNLCKADFFTTNNKTVTCEGGTIVFNDASWNGTPTTYSWSFPGGTPSTATTQTVTVTYPTAGVYNVSLTVGDGTSSPSVTKTNLITVYSTTAMTAVPFTEGFESGGAVPNANWMVSNPDNKTYKWQTTTAAKYSGTSCVMVNNFSNDTAQIEELMGPTIDCTKLGNPKLYFKIAYAQKDASSNDQLKINISTNCGVSWIVKKTESGNNMKSVPPQATAFTPTSTSQWRSDSVTNLNVGSSSNVRIKFQFINADGNNIYIDDINITGSTLTSINDELAGNLDFHIYPNPTQDRSIVEFNLVNNSKVSVKLLDILGNEVLDLVNGQQLAEGNYKFPVSRNAMSSGVYFVRLMIDDRLFTQKLLLD